MKKMYPGVDLFKVIAAFGVVAIHTKLPYLRVVGHLSVPFFIIISSFFFFKKYVKSSDKQSKIKRFAYRITMLFLCWQLFYIPIAIISFNKYWEFYKHTKKAIFIYSFHFILSPATGVRYANGWATSWYLIAILIGIPLFCACIYFLNDIVLFVCSFLIEIYMILSTSYSNLTGLKMLGYYSFPRAIPYIFLGYVLVKNKKIIVKTSTHKVFIAFTIAFLMFILEYSISSTWNLGNRYEELFLTYPTGLLLAIIAIKYQASISNKQSLYLRNFSTFLYCVHEGIIFFLLGMFEWFNGKPMWLFISVSIISILLFQIYYLLKKKYNWPYLKFMV